MLAEAAAPLVQVDFFSTSGLIALVTLSVLEVVLGIDNLIFIAILAGKLPKEKQSLARKLGLALSVITRLGLVACISLIMKLTSPLILWFSGRDLLLLGGGLFLIAKSTKEIHEKLEAAEHTAGTPTVAAAMGTVLVQMAIVGVVFSLDSVITAVGMTSNVWIMAAAIVISSAAMVLAADAISGFVDRHPTMKVLALSFLILIGAMLVIEGWNSEKAHELNLKNYIYFAMAFSFVIELLNIRMRKKAGPPVHLHNEPHLPGEEPKD